MLKFKFAACKNTVMIIPIHKILHGSNILCGRELKLMYELFSVLAIADYSR